MAQPSSRSTDAWSIRWRALLGTAPILAFFFGALLSAGAFLLVHRHEERVRQIALEGVAASRAVAVQQALEGVVGQIRATAVYLGTKGALDQGDIASFRPEFRSYVDELVQSTPALLTVSLVPRVPRGDLPAFIERARPTDGSPFELTERAPDGTLVPLRERPVYFPLAIVGLPVPGPLRGVDLGADSALRARLEGAIDTRDPLIVDIDQALPPLGDAELMGVLVPIPATGGRSTRWPGFALGLVDLPRLVQQALAALPEERVDVELVYAATGEVVRPSGAPASPSASSDSAWLRRAPIAESHQVWDLVTRATPEFQRPEDPLTEWLVLVGGLLLSALLAAHLGLARSREAALAALAQERQEVADQLRAIFSSSLDAIISADDHGVISEWNPSAERLFGWRPDEVMGKTLADTVIPPEDRQGHLAALQHLRETGSSPLIGPAFEYVMQQRDGSRLPVELVMTPTPIRGRVRITAFIRDISTRKRAEVQMRRNQAELERRVHERTAELEQAGVRIAEREQRLRLLVENAGDAVFLMDEHGRLADVNKRACSMLGYEREELLALGLHDIETRADPERPIGPRLASLLVGEVMTSHGEQRRKDGTTVPVEVRVGPIEAGEHRLYLSLVRDVTERRAMEAALADARDKAIEASRLKSDFLANMSHEIRTPLNGILGMTGLLLESELTAGQREDLETVRQSGQHLLGLINDILDLARIEAGRFHLDSTRFALEDVLHGVAALLCAAAEQKGIEFILRIAPGTPRSVVGDAARLRQVLVNLAGNAVKFTEQGHVLLEAECLSVEDGRAALRFAVTDTGIGISQADLDRVFEKFTQADTSMARRHGGTGLGLTISRQIVDAMGGTITAQSTVGRGSVFSFSIELPLGEEVARPATPRELVGVRALVVDDNAVNRRVLEEQIGSWRMRGTAVASPAEALIELDVAARNGDPYRIALLDFQMEGMDGLELARRIQARPELGRPTVLLLSSVGRHFDADVVVEAGIARWLTKPVTPSELLDAVSQAWDQEEPAGAGVGASPTGEGSAAVPTLHVLLAEDSAVNQKVAVRMLSKLGCRVDVASNGIEAVHKVERSRYDIIFMDCQMPEMDGYEATRRIRAGEDAGRHTPIVALTAHAMEGDRERCLDAGMDDYLSKPVPREDLERMLARYAGGAAPARGEGVTVAAAERRAFDTDALLRAVDGDSEILAELARTFREQSLHQLPELDTAAAAGDAHAVQRLGHALKGALATLYARDAAALAHAVEEAGRAGSPDQALRVIPRLNEMVRAIPDQLIALARKLDGARSE